MSATSNPKVLVIHNLQSDTRKTTVEFTSSFGVHGKGLEVHYLNLFGLAASMDLRENYDIAIVTAEALSTRDVAYWPDVKKRIIRILKQAKLKVLFPQDDYTFSSRLDELVIDARIDAVWTPLPNDPVLYPKSVARGVRFMKCLTGYVEDSSLPRYAAHSKKFEDRQIDLGQRVSALPSSFGNVGERKSIIARRIAGEFRTRGMRVDVSFDPEDVLLGDEWLSFLGNSRFTVSRKGGSSIADTQFRMTESLQRLRSVFGRLSESSLCHLASKRGVFRGSWEEVSPRLFEAAAMGVCQILEEDNFLEGAMTPWVHYIPLDSDFANIEEIFSFILREDLVKLMVEESKKALIDSGHYSYGTFVSHFFKLELGRDYGDEFGASITVDLDESPGILSKNQLSGLRRYFETVNPLTRAFPSTDAQQFEHAYKELMRHELLPESMTRDWVGLKFHNFPIP